MKVLNRRPFGGPVHRPALIAGAVLVSSTLLLAGNTVASAAGTPKSASGSPKPAATMPMTTMPMPTMVDGVSVPEDTALAATVPASVKKAGLLDITYNDFAPDEYVSNGQLVGWEVDLGHAVAATLGLAWKPTSSGSFDTFIPSLQDGRFNSSFTSFIVTSARTKVIDIVSLYNVGTGFAAKVGSSVKTVNSSVDLCGDTVAVIVASAFIGQLSGLDPACKNASKPTINVQTYPSDAAAELAVASGRADLYATSVDDIGWLIHKTGHEFFQEPLNLQPGPEGVGITKGIGLDTPVTQAVNHLISTGTYKTLMSKWGVTGGLLTRAVDYNK
jgi:polar amino acid transport system substrate-binding protein